MSAAGSPGVVSKGRTPDVLVVGAGLVGCAVAMQLAARGLSVTVLEQAGVACATSGSGMGHVFVVPRPQSMARMTLRSAALWSGFAAACQARGEPFYWRPCGVHWVAEGEAELPGLERVARELRSLGETVHELSGSGLQRSEPGLALDLAGGLFHPRDAVLYPVHGAAAMLRQARRFGARVVTGSAVERLALEEDPRGGGLRVRGVVVDGQLLEGERVVPCAGVLAPRLLERSGLPGLPVYPRRGEVAVTAPGVDAVSSQILEVGYLDQAQGESLWDPTVPGDPGSASCYLQPQPDGRCLIGATRCFPDPIRPMDRRVDRQLLAKSLHRAARFVPSLKHAPIVRAWAGLRPFTVDQRPMVGPVPGIQGLYLACGHEGLGLTLSQVTGEVLVGMILGDLPAELAADTADWLPADRMPRIAPEAVLAATAGDGAPSK